MKNDIILVLLTILMIRMILENKLLSITFYHVNSSKLPKDFKGKRIVLLTDLHNNHFGKRNKKLLDAIDKQKPDIVMIVGDMLIGHSKADNFIAYDLVREIAKKYKVYYSYGNHEKKLSINPKTCDSTFLDYENTLRNHGVHFLVNQTENIKNIAITGLDISIDFYLKRHRPNMDRLYLEDTLGKIDKSKFNILLAHNPVYFKEYANWGADLVLSGHVHGGIIRIPGLGGFISPQYVFFPKYDHGKFKEGSSTMILSRGLGSHTLKVRLFNKPELVVIDLNIK